MRAELLEAYPLDSPDGKYRPECDAFRGFASTFERLGVRQASARSPVRNIYRLRDARP